MDEALKEILGILRCPEKLVPLRAATEEEIGRLEAARRAGTLLTRAGKKVEAPIEEALVREGGDLAYPLREGIPILIIEEGIELP